MLTAHLLAEEVLKVNGKPDQMLKAGDSFQLPPGIVHDAREAAQGATRRRRKEEGNGTRCNLRRCTKVGQHPTTSSPWTAALIQQCLTQYFPGLGTANRPQPGIPAAFLAGVF
jgi:hypothetical protein